MRARDRLRPVDAVLPKRPLDGASGKRQRRGDFDFKGKARAEVRAVLVTDAAAARRAATRTNFLTPAAARLTHVCTRARTR